MNLFVFMMLPALVAATQMLVKDFVIMPSFKDDKRLVISIVAQPVLSVRQLWLAVDKRLSLKTNSRFTDDFNENMADPVVSLTQLHFGLVFGIGAERTRFLDFLTFADRDCRSVFSCDVFHADRDEAINELSLGLSLTLLDGRQLQFSATDRPGKTLIALTKFPSVRAQDKDMIRLSSISVSKLQKGTGIDEDNFCLSFFGNQERKVIFQLTPIQGGRPFCVRTHIKLASPALLHQVSFIAKSPILFEPFLTSPSSSSSSSPISTSSSTIRRWHCRLDNGRRLMLQVVGPIDAYLNYRVSILATSTKVSVSLVNFISRMLRRARRKVVNTWIRHGGRIISLIIGIIAASLYFKR